MGNTGVVGDAVSTLVDAVASMMVGDAVSMSMSMADEATSMLMADKAMSMAVGDAKSTAVAGDEPSILVDASRLVMVGEGADESVDPDPVVSTVGTN
jgi:hypothetical protein